MKIKTVLISLILIVLVHHRGFAQFSLERFLGSARDDISLDPAQAKIDFLKENNYSGPWISRVEFRTRSNDANLSWEDYRFRLTPGNPAELKANKRYYQKEVELLNLEYKDLLNNALVERYFIALDHIFESNKKLNLEKQLAINRQITEMINSGTGVYCIDLGDLIDTESDELDMRMDIENAQIRLDEIEYLMKEHYDFSGKIDWSQSELLEVGDILNLFDEFRNLNTGEHIDLVKMEQKNQLAAERYNIEKSESMRNIGYFQAEYDTERGDEAFDHFGYQIGIRIPIVNPDKPDLNRRKLATMDDHALLEEKRDNYRRKMELSVLRMHHYARQYREIEEKLALLRSQNYLNFQRLDEAVKISDLIKINEFHMDLLDKKNAVAKQIYENYLRYLNLGGKLAEAPLRNYLAKGMPEF
jgi:hypothetical protein